ncbi:hypothetical protein V5O48_003008 [Marasmius crinis-equi]|uniref:Cystathionine gamma-synthase n=1 Tax=Marasmius crinis-equi TaxID=585013 RepID=A0ABR3FUG0_9AGAR
MSSTLRPADLLHGDEHVGNGPQDRADVAPPISVASTFRSDPDPEAIEFADGDMRNPKRHVYSRYTQDVRGRTEHILSKINALTHYAPKRIAVRDGYFGCHESFEIYKRGRDVEIVDLDVDYQEGDLCWLETPVNPTGESRDLKYYAEKVHKVGGKLVVDSTLGPPPLQYPFKFGADCILHSATKYFGGHSDLLAGVLIVKTEEEWSELMHDRTYLGMVTGSLESWLLLRSLRTLHLRIPRQSENATALAKWLQTIVEETASGKPYDGVPPGIIKQVYHSSLQQTDARGFHPKTQMEGGYNALFAITLTNVKKAKHLPAKTQLFVSATSLGGVESLIEYRNRADAREDPLLVRISVGVEDIEELKDDLRQALQKVAELKAQNE